ncbi:putative ferredoxin-NADP reductase [Babesia sp. Xinjiang]|uniref:putative ferredoxin-NADP reductase n=1 Tax=Babesia sp. Xinjiang TaxID=462227 RepID=UPI000A24386B|nr:putative ferredoxin-NADP reductase [Babesia sp. Xinjiang]ORM39578.1 putative ferredoxin-NADP reductase [Babesia sp. Xinjiang]
MGTAWVLFWLCFFTGQYIRLLKCYRRQCDNALTSGRTFRLSDSNVLRYTVKVPLECDIRSVRLIGTNGSDRSFYHIVVDHKGQYNFVPGQYCGILPPGISERTKRPHLPRSYSLAPVLEEDGVDPSTCFSIGLRAPIITPDNVESFRDSWICSRFLSGASSGTPVRITGPFGKFMLSADDLEGKHNLLFVATGTGIAPYLGFLKSILESSSSSGSVTDVGRILLFFGIQSPSTYIYRTVLEDYVSKFNGRLTVVPCYSRYGSESERGYVQDMILRQRDLVNSMCFSGGRECSIFICGCKSMDKAVCESLRTVFSENPDRDAILSRAKVEVYD